MPDEHSTWIIREITDVVATATELGRRRTNGEAVSNEERLQLQRRKVDVLRAIAERTPDDAEIRDVVAQAERQLARMAPTATTTPAAPTASSRPGVTR